ncbi:hypothetical protein AVEN_112968-1, partial [Araneus ventricosus]
MDFCVISVVFPDKPLLFLTDSLSVLLALQNFSSKSPSVIHKLVHKLLEKSLTNNHITLLWIPGHSTILWNEKADFIAKLVTEHSPYINWIASEDILSHMKHNSKKRTSGNYRDNKYYEELGEIPDIRSIFKWTKNRREDIICARIFSKTLITPGLLNKFNLSDNPMCNTCNVMNNLDHILLHCSSDHSSQEKESRVPLISAADRIQLHLVVIRETLAK